MTRIVAVVALLLMMIATAAVWRLLDAPVVEVRVSGELDQAERAQVELAIAESLDGGLLSADLNDIHDALRALSWPRHVSIRRVWPNSLEVSVAKALVVAGWGEDYLTIDGQVVQLASDQRDLVHFDCQLTAPKTALELYQRLQRDVAAAGLQITHLHENGLGEWTLTFSNAIELNIGASDLTDRVTRFVSVYQQQLQHRTQEVVLVDARYANGIAVSWRAAPAPGRERGLDDRLAMHDAGNQMRVSNGSR